ncbi:hypothetical protein AALO_G00156290 [Alosa alosa]|uniref:Uncharacterized protein n=1 Tax=Alosa alosa TaxID=278164 RepID=A0AAV6GLZ8_9TELE|nr:hypothetical protein AALO_G00156290 [Alosa alosa]
MSLWSALGEVVSSVTEEMTDIVNTAFGEEDSQEDGDKDLLTAVGRVMAGAAEVSKAMASASLGLTKGVTGGMAGAIGAACSAGSTGEAVEAAADILAQSVAGEFVDGMKDLSNGSKMVVKGVRQSIKVCSEK